MSPREFWEGPATASHVPRCRSPKPPLCLRVSPHDCRCPSPPWRAHCSTAHFFPLLAAPHRSSAVATLAASFPCGTHPFPILPKASQGLGDHFQPDFTQVLFRRQEKIPPKEQLMPSSRCGYRPSSQPRPTLRVPNHAWFSTYFQTQVPAPAALLHKRSRKTNINVQRKKATFLLPLSKVHLSDSHFLAEHEARRINSKHGPATQGSPSSTRVGPMKSHWEVVAQPLWVLGYSDLDDPAPKCIHYPCTAFAFVRG